jgi:Ulp1 family protease
MISNKLTLSPKLSCAQNIMPRPAKKTSTKKLHKPVPHQHSTLEANWTHMPNQNSLDTNNNIINLLHNEDDVNIPAEHFNSYWRQMYAEHIRHHANIHAPYAHPDHIWMLTEEQMNITELYYLQAQNMITSNLINVFMPNYMMKYTHEPSDVISMQRHNWLTGTIIDLFLLSIDVDIATGHQKHFMNILGTAFYVTLTNTLDDDTQRPGYNTYNFAAISTYTSHYTREDFFKCTIIPVHVTDHWLLCIIDPLNTTIYIIDSLRKNNTNIISNIVQWYQTELINHDYDIAQINVNSWNIINSSNIPSSVPRQRDGSSCGIFVSMTAYYWYRYRRLPDKNTDWNESNVNSLTPNLRHFVLHHIFHTVYLENARILNVIL